MPALIHRSRSGRQRRRHAPRLQVLAAGPRPVLPGGSAALFFSTQLPDLACSRVSSRSDSEQPPKPSKREGELTQAECPPLKRADDKAPGPAG